MGIRKDTDRSSIFPIELGLWGSDNFHAQFADKAPTTQQDHELGLLACPNPLALDG
jgi:hypothetical protein